MAEPDPITLYDGEAIQLQPGMTVGHLVIRSGPRPASEGAQITATPDAEDVS